MKNLIVSCVTGGDGVLKAEFFFKKVDILEAYALNLIDVLKRLARERFSETLNALGTCREGGREEQDRRFSFARDQNTVGPRVGSRDQKCGWRQVIKKSFQLVS